MSSDRGDGPLSPDEVNTYKNDGWVVPQVSIPGNIVDRLRNTLDRLIEQNPGVRPERLVSAHLEENPGDEGTIGSSDFLELAYHPLILDAVAQLIGPDFCLWGCQIFCKPGGDGMQVPMHQDGHYWPIRPLATCTVWLALDSSDSSNGCLRVVPRSHINRQTFDHFTSGDPKLVLNQAITPAELARLAEPADVELAPGQFSCHDVYVQEQIILLVDVRVWHFAICLQLPCLRGT